MQAVIVGHGSSILEIEPDIIDSFDFVIRLKDTPAKVGRKTSAVCSTSKIWFKEGNYEKWLFHEREYDFRRPDVEKWMEYWKSFDPAYHKPSNGCCAAFCAKEFLEIDEITLAGFDMLKNGSPDKLGQKRNWWLHDHEAERRALNGLFEVNLI